MEGPWAGQQQPLPLQVQETGVQGGEETVCSLKQGGQGGPDGDDDMGTKTQDLWRDRVKEGNRNAQTQKAGSVPGD